MRPGRGGSGCGDPGQLGDRHDREHRACRPGGRRRAAGPDRSGRAPARTGPGGVPQRRVPRPGRAPCRSGPAGCDPTATNRPTAPRRRPRRSTPARTGTGSASAPRSAPQPPGRRPQRGRDCTRRNPGTGPIASAQRRIGCASTPLGVESGGGDATMTTPEESAPEGATTADARVARAARGPRPGRACDAHRRRRHVARRRRRPARTRRRSR